MNKKLLFLLTAVLFSMASAFAQECDYSGSTGPLQWCLKDGTLTISGTGAMPDYEWGGPWFEYKESINICVIETGVTTIGAFAFVYCINMTYVTIPNSVTTIGGDAFQGCYSLASITIPNSVTTIEQNAFSICVSLTSITIPNSVTTIGWSVFIGCTSLTSIDVESGNSAYASENGVLFNKSKSDIICCPAGKSGAYVIPSSVTTIGYRAFYGCVSLTSISIPNSVTTIGVDAFNSCTGLTSMTIPNSVITIQMQAFVGCESLTSIAIPNSVTTIGDMAFSGCTSLTSIDVENENSNYASENGVLFNKNKTTLIRCPGGKTEAYVIPNSVTTIEPHAFGKCASLTSITIPNSVTTIGGSAFWLCTSLTSITNLNLVPKEINNWTFYEVNQSECTLIVPTSAVSAYQTAEVWKKFNIVGGGILVNPVSSNNEQGYVTGNGLYDGGGKSTATVTAVAYEGYKFVNWTKNGSEVSTENPYSFTVTEDVELVANFEGSVGIVRLSQKAASFFI